MKTSRLSMLVVSLAIVLCFVGLSLGDKKELSEPLALDSLVHTGKTTIDEKTGKQIYEVITLREWLERDGHPVPDLNAPPTPTHPPPKTPPPYIPPPAGYVSPLNFKGIGPTSMKKIVDAREKGINPMLNCHIAFYEEIEIEPFEEDYEAEREAWSQGKEEVVEEYLLKRKERIISWNNSIDQQRLQLVEWKRQAIEFFGGKLGRNTSRFSNFYQASLPANKIEAFYNANSDRIDHINLIDKDLIAGTVSNN